MHTVSMPPGAERSPRQLWRLAILVAFATLAALFVRITGPTEQLATGADPVQAAAGPTRPPALTVALTGEILPHPSVVEHARRFGAATGVAYDFGPMFALIADHLAAADLAICHLEVPVAPAGEPLSGYPDFGIPAEIGPGIGSAGWDRCSTASNHVVDRGTAGIVATLDALDAGGVTHHGTARSADEAAVTGVIEVDGVRVAHLSYTWGFNGSSPREAWMANTIDPARILADATRARADGAAVVIVSVHWGDEYDSAGSAAQRSLADQLLASPDIDLLVGHGPHVLQPIEVVHGKYALLSVGNLVANQGSERPSTYDGVIVDVTFSLGADGRYSAAAPMVHPTWYDPSAGVVRVVSPSLADPALAPIAPQLQASLARTRAVMDPYVVLG
ncbi:MAG: hypothetical protein RL238_2903 [Actinomycetota bacterium]